MNRRAWLFRAGGVGAAALAARAQAQERDSSAAADPLQRPDLAGQPRAVAGQQDSDPGVIAIERRLRCTCGCNLDIYTCRTTDFSCTYSPALHRDVLDQLRAGSTSDQVVAAFVAKYGESILMAPTPQGFNVLGYLVPGIVVVMASAILVWVVRRRRIRRPAEVPAALRPVSVIPASDQERVEQALRDLN